MAKVDPEYKVLKAVEAGYQLPTSRISLICGIDSYTTKDILEKLVKEKRVRKIVNKVYLCWELDRSMYFQSRFMRMGDYYHIFARGRNYGSFRCKSE